MFLCLIETKMVFQFTLFCQNAKIVFVRKLLACFDNYYIIITTLLHLFFYMFMTLNNFKLMQ